MNAPQTTKFLTQPLNYKQLIPCTHYSTRINPKPIITTPKNFKPLGFKGVGFYLTPLKKIKIIDRKQLKIL